MHLKPCSRCRFDGHCSEQAAIRGALKAAKMPKGHRLTSLLFTCRKRWEGFEAGRRVTVCFEGGNPDYYEEISGWIVETGYGPPPGKMRVWLDHQTERGRRYIALWPYDTTTISLCLRDERREVADIRHEIEVAAAEREGREWEERIPDSWIEKTHGLEPGSLSEY